jgi:predicted nucleic acid-binding protein
MRIRLEAAAVQLILSHARVGNISLLTSPALRYEVSKNPDPVRRKHVQLVLQEIGIPVDFTLHEVRQRANTLNIQGIRPADATHLALAEQAGCDFVTVDDRFLRQLRRFETTIWCVTPIAYCEKEDLR